VEREGRGKWSEAGEGKGERRVEKFLDPSTQSVHNYLCYPANKQVNGQIRSDLDL